MVDNENEDDIDVTIEEEPSEIVDIQDDGDDKEKEPKEDAKYVVDDLKEDNQPAIEKRRLSSKEKRERQREQRARLEARVSALTTQNMEMQRRLQATEGGQLGLRLEGLKSKKEEIQNLYNQTQQRLSQYEEAGNLRGTREAVELKFRLENEYKILEEHERQLSQSASRPPPLDGSTVNYFKGWVDRNPWFKSDISNEDSRIADVISRSLLDEGFHVSQPEYWEELDRRCASRIPAKGKNSKKSQPQYDDDDDDPPPQTVSGRGSTSRNESGRVEVKIDAWTKQQWKNAGIWDDPKERNKAIKEYVSMMEKD